MDIFSYDSTNFSMRVLNFHLTALNKLFASNVTEKFSQLKIFLIKNYTLWWIVKLAILNIHNLDFIPEKIYTRLILMKKDLEQLQSDKIHFFHVIILVLSQFFDLSAMLAALSPLKTLGKNE